MPITINGDGSITGLSVGGLPNGSVDADTLASNAVTTNKIANSAVTETKTSGVVGTGLKVIDQWHLTSDTTGNQNPLSGWSRMTSAFSAKSAMTESSGTWSFPEIGYYMVFLDWIGRCDTGEDNRWSDIDFMLSTNSGSSYSRQKRSLTSHYNDPNGTPYASATPFYIVDVTNASTFRLQFKLEFENNTGIQSTSGLITTAMFIRLGDT